MLRRKRLAQSSAFATRSFKPKSLLAALGAAGLSFALATPSHAVLERFGPINNSPTVGGFPAWAQDKTGLALEFCDLMSQAEFDGGWCLLIPPGPVFPESFPINFFGEHFYFDAGASLNGSGIQANLGLALEATFLQPTPIPGDQMVFGRIRFVLRSVPVTGTYTVHHPYGTWIFLDVPAGDRIFFTEDIGVACIGTFTCALDSNIGPFLLPSATPGGAEVPPIPDILAGQDPYYDALVTAGAATPYPGTGKKYIADPGRLGPVTGSPLPPFLGSDGLLHNHNTFRIEGPGGLVLQTDNFSLMGRVMTGALPGNVKADRASYTKLVTTPNGNNKKLDVFATANPTSTGRVPAQPTPPAITPILTFFDVPCAGTVDPVTGAILPPYSKPATGNEIQMVNAGNKYWGQTHPVAIPTHSCLEDSTARDAAGNVVPVFYNVKVTDEVAITALAGSSGAVYDAANGGTLTVKATSSDTEVPPVLTVAGYGDMVNGTLTVTPLAAPPAKVSVVSSEGGSAELLVTTNVGTAGGGGATVPLAVNDDVSMFEDCSATTATACATPLVITPLANDTFQGAPITTGTVTITAQPRLGTAVLNLDNTITYTPNANVSGVEGIGYTVTVNGIVSNIAYITINVAAVNDAPVAVNDATDAVVAVANSINVMANDTDVDGIADPLFGLGTIQILTWPAELGPQPVPAGGVVSFTPTTSGTFTFTYNVVDNAGAASVTPATVTVTVRASETISFVRSEYRASQARWTVTGADNVHAGQTLTIVYNDGTLTAAEGGGTCNGTATLPKCVLGTAVVDGLGNWALDVRAATGSLNPTSASWTTRPTVVRAFSSSPVLGGSRTNSIAFR
ncbi:MAG TPA: Ig-like domain-containing protein [Usitatibacteraceae bacterium]|nr:Ig-like domain-containing protein [Usitatibacteraceae bacterium]